MAFKTIENPAPTQFPDMPGLLSTLKREYLNAHPEEKPGKNENVEVSYHFHPSKDDRSGMFTVKVETIDGTSLASRFTTFEIDDLKALRRTEFTLDSSAQWIS